MPKNKSFFFVPWEKPANIFFKIKLTQEAKLTLTYLNTVTMKESTLPFCVNPHHALNLDNLVGRLGVTELMQEKRMCPGPKYFAAFISAYTGAKSIEKYLFD
jgi:hypothetical protein